MPAVAKIRSILENHSTLRNGRHVMSYVQLARSRQICREHYGDLYDICFWPRVFVAFPAIAAPPVMVIETRFLIKYIEEFERILQTRKELNGLARNGRLTSASLIDFATRKLKPFYALEATNGSDLKAACRLASRKFVFYHDRRGGITVENVASGMTAWELDNILKCFQDQDEGRDERRCNWFSDKVIFSILSAFSNVAGGADGVMNLEQFASLSSFSSLSSHFVSSLFLHLGRKKMGLVNVSERKGVMELEDYADFVLAWNDRQSPAAVKYIFKIFDRNATGYLTTKDMLPFLQQCVEQLAMDDPEGVYEGMPDDMVTEILDMVRPAEQTKMDVWDIIRCKNGYEIFGMMADTTDLYQHEHKHD